MIETRDNNELKDVELTVLGYELFRKDHSDDLLGGEALFMINDTIAAVLSPPFPLVVRNHNLLASNISPPGSLITICVILIKAKSLDSNVPT